MEENNNNEFPVYTFTADNVLQPITIDVLLNNKFFTIELDSGAALSCLRLFVYEKHFQHLPLFETNITLIYFTGGIILPIGQIELEVYYNNRTKLLKFCVVGDTNVALLGRDLIYAFNIGFQETNHIRKN